jgi:hypothetical protein
MQHDWVHEVFTALLPQNIWSGLDRDSKHALRAVNKHMQGLTVPFFSSLECPSEVNMEDLKRMLGSMTGLKSLELKSVEAVHVAFFGGSYLGGSMTEESLHLTIRTKLHLDQASFDSICSRTFRCLQTLHASDGKFGDLSGLANCSMLSTLDLSDNYSITNISSLKTLNLRDLAVADCGLLSVEALKGLTQLTKLDLSGNSNITIGDLHSTLCTLTSLIDVCLFRCGIDSVQAVVTLTNLTNLNLGDTTDHLSDLAAITILTNLIDLGLSGRGITSVQPLVTLKKLTKLDLDFNHNITDLCLLISVFNLRVLSLGCASLDSLQMQGLGCLTQVTELDLSTDEDYDITELPALRCMVNLRVLSLNYASLDSLQMQGLACLTQITKLDIRHSSFTDLGPLGALTSLAELDIQWCNDPPTTAIEALSASTSLRKLIVSDDHTFNLEPIQHLMPSLRVLKVPVPPSPR